jgi:hypothetical protein
LTPTVSGATCVLSNLEGSWTVVTPTVAHVQRGHEDLMVKCNAPGYQEAWTTLPSHTDMMTLANVANFGVGVGIDSYTGAIDAYPHSVSLAMQPAPPPSPQAPESPPLTSTPLLENAPATPSAPPSK